MMLFVKYPKQHVVYKLQYRTSQRNYPFLLHIFFSHTDTLIAIYYVEYIEHKFFLDWLHILKATSFWSLRQL